MPVLKRAFTPAPAATSTGIAFVARTGGRREEPALNDVLADPLVHRLMERDGVEMKALVLFICEAKRRLR
jgi:hypothetical protein